jgi:phosphate starvation-inducible membrane PsiE
MEHHDQDTSRIAAFAATSFLKIEVICYMILGLLLGLTAFLGVFNAAVSLVHTMIDRGEADSIVETVDRLLFVLMVVEILHTVRVSFREGTLVCEPFLIVGLIASVRRMLAITLESSQVNSPSKWGPDSADIFRATMTELSVLGGLILIMVIAIFILRRSQRPLVVK